jgi:hypothetical protein
MPRVASRLGAAELHRSCAAHALTRVDDIGLTRVTFKPYNRTQLQTIVAARYALPPWAAC